jgi:transposase
MGKAYKFRIYPRQAEAEIMQKVLDTCILLYNTSLAERKDSYETERKKFNYYDQANALSTAKSDNQKWIKTQQKKLANEQRRLTRKRKGSNNRKKQKAKIQSGYRTLRNQRSDFIHKLSAKWNQLVQYTMYKAEEAGTIVELVEPRGTSQECSSCGAIVQKTLAVRIHKCPHCGLVMDRDENVARNILGRSKYVAQGLRESTPVEILSGWSMNQDAPVFILG